MTAQQALEEYRRVFARGVTPADYLVNGVVDLDHLTWLRARKLHLLHAMTGLMGDSNSIAETICDAQRDHVDGWQVDAATGRVFCVQCVVARAVRQTVKGSAKA